MTWGMAPTERIWESSTLEDWMRIFWPLKSSTVLERLVGAHDLEAVIPVGQTDESLWSRVS